ncbi:MAG: class I SAM-dependent methyltransferase [Smithellaceae bacterium]
MSYILNTTNNYHINDLNSLGWEMTVCNALYPETSPCRKALKSNKSFGVLLYQFLQKIFPLNNINNILEIGGGLGNLMHNFLSLNPQLKATMIDISPNLLAKQKELLQGFAVDFREMDILQIAVSTLSPFDLVIMNENLGDLPALVVNPANKLPSTEDLSSFHRANHFIEKYQLPVAQNENINIGALEIMEKLCNAGIKYIYLSEHSCEAVVPDYLKSCFHFTALGNPEKISLKGHDEYTIKFSCLQRIAEKFNYKTVRGPFADFLELDFNDKVRTALQLRVPHTDEQEILQHFVYDLYKYEYLVLIKGGE